MELKSIGGTVLFALETATYFCDLVVAAVAANKDLRGADLRGAELTGADLRGADLRGAYLRGAELTGADLRGADLRGAYLTGADLRGAYLRGAELTGAELTGADLTGADLRGAYLTGADLTGADLTGADLRGAYLTGADLTGALIDGKKVKKMRVFSGLYEYEIWAVLFEDGTRMVRMGCLYESLDKWEKIGIRKSNLAQYPDDKSESSEERVLAFKFAKAAAMRLK